MKLSYFELLSPDPIYIEKVGSIISPKLKDISSIGINTYHFYLSILLMDLKTLLTMDNDSISILQNALNFFIKENVIYSNEHHSFLIMKNDTAVGIINEDIYPLICDIICQRNCIKTNKEEDLSKVKSKKALDIIKKLQKGRAEKAKQTKTDKNMELGNIISSVANKSQSLNIINIWELTVYQVWDCFSRLTNNSIYDIQSMSVAAWGNKDNHFDAASWYRRIDTAN
ncbi:MAG: hypothetical protein J1D87_04165 [Lachnospiraceae bacterium]|nr:hypothetical protein [Lachnospiraceae bacterium]